MTNERWAALEVAIDKWASKWKGSRRIQVDRYSSRFPEVGESLEVRWEEGWLRAYSARYNVQLWGHAGSELAELACAMAVVMEDYPEESVNPSPLTDEERSVVVKLLERRADHTESDARRIRAEAGDPLPYERPAQRDRWLWSLHKAERLETHTALLRSAAAKLGRAGVHAEI